MENKTATSIQQPMNRPDGSNRVSRKRRSGMALLLAAALIVTPALARAQCGADPGDDDQANATSLGSSCGDHTAAIDCANDVDWYAFTAPNGGTFTFSTSGTGGYDTLLSLYVGGRRVKIDNNSVSYALSSGQSAYLLVEADIAGDVFNYTLTTSGCSGGGCGNDPGNDDFGSATDLGNQCSITGAAIDCIGDLDYYRFQAPSSGSYNVYTTGGTDTFLALYDSSYNVLTTDDDSGQDHNASIVYTLSQGVIYYIEVNEYANDATGTYHLNVSGCSGGGCPGDPGNDDKAHATDLGGCGIAPGAIDCSGDVDYYTFQAAAAGTYTFTMSPANRAGMILYASDGTTEVDAGQNSVTASLTAGDFTYLEVSAGSPGDTFTYNLTISGCSCGSDPGNDTQATATDLNGHCGATHEGIDCAGDVDWFKFVSPGTSTVTFETTGSTDTYMELWDGSNNKLAEDDDGGTDHNAKISHALSAGATYFVKVRGYDASTTGDYALVVSGCECGTDPGDDDQAHATDLGSSCGDHDAKINCGSDVDWYTFSAPNDGTFTFATTGTGGHDTLLSLYVGGQRVEIDNNTVSHTLSSGQSAYLLVQADTAGQVFNYTLTTSGCSGGGCPGDPGNDDMAHATDLGGCGIAPGAIDCSGDVDYYTFQAAAAGTYTFTMSPANRAGMILYASDGTTEVDAGQNSVTASLTSGDFTYLEVSAMSPGDTFTYEVTISGCSCGADPGNDTQATATDLNGRCGTTHEGIDCAGDVDWFKLVSPGVSTVTFETTGATDTYMELWDGSNNKLAENDDDGADHNAKISYALSAGGTYFVKVKGYNPGTTGDYALVVSGCECGTDPGDDDQAHATDLGTACGDHDAKINCGSDVDWYAFTAPNDGTFTFSTSGTGGHDTLLSLYVGGQRVEIDNNTVSHTLSSGQSAYLLVQADIAGQVFNYTLTTNGCSGGGCGTDPGDDDQAHATSLGSSCGDHDAKINCGSDVDWYTFTAPNDGTFTFSTTGTGGHDTLLSLYVGGQRVEIDNNTVSHTLSSGQSAYLQVQSDTAGEVFDYTLTTNGCSGGGGCGTDPGNDDAAHATPLAGCGMLSAALDCPGDEDHYSFSPAVDGAYTIDLGATFNAGIEVHDASGQLIGQDVAQISSYLTTADGPFDITVLSPLGLIGGYTLNVSGCQGGSCSGDTDGDTVATGTSLAGCGATSHQLDCAGDVDVFLFTAPTSGSYTIETTGTTDTMLTLSAAGAILTSDDDTGIDHNARITADLSQGTAYEVTVRGYNGATGSYGLKIDGCSSTGSTHVYYIPASAKVKGLVGTDWRSDLAVLNLGSSEANVTVEAWLRDQANPNPMSVQRRLAPGAALNESDLLSTLFGMSSGSAALRLVSDQPLAVSSRTYNLTSSGTYGQFIPGVPAIQAIEAGQTAYLLGFEEDAHARSNLGLVNLSDSEITITVTFFKADGAQLGTPRAYTVPGHGFIQRTRVLTEVSADPVDLAWARLTASSGSFLGYLSMIDNDSGDPTYRSLLRAPKDSVDYVLPGIAKVSGAAGTNWVSDLTVLNTSTTGATATVELWVRDAANGTPAHKTLTLAAGQSLRLADVLPKLFNMNDGAAAFRVLASAGVLLDARTFNLVSTGTYGQYVPAMTLGDAVTASSPGCFLMVAQGSAFRTNFGMVNAGKGTVDLEVSLFDAGGNRVGSTRTFHLAERAVLQANRIVEQFTSSGFGGGYIVATVPSSFADGAVHPFTTVVDQKTGDPIYETPVLLPAGSSLAP